AALQNPTRGRLSMLRFLANVMVVAALAVSVPWIVAAQEKLPLQPMSEAEMRARTDKVIANQHANDEALDQYQRLEHQVERTGGGNPRVLEDRLYRVVPTGPGTMKILLKSNGQSTDAAEYRKQLLAWKNTLEIILKPNDSRTKAAYAKADKKKKD